MKNLHQVHFLASKEDYEFLIRQAEERNETVSTLLRRMLRHHRIHGVRVIDGGPASGREGGETNDND